ncbi:MAG: hypothetical protein MPEBLZ_00553 [Candidatus Methanoperedens nitroreducens]|uniref:Uncharacterized protein n=1 Tax=Candidatus Methanoperedens nitratireducens TaxID=1392998 RepID=A0A0N8KRG5_9EURY|nr:hypothetical protein [Candidatus Methanoperedens sp. BLZ2]KAB2942130.1 MAG: hypothetical protein F9K14_17570 [Candidatus Methanoperedens sp.]KPQ44874.1 MAG: hypothetical protein MPEBLZ_00553 [Candidatus Methanoperedens sp. BLZ1]MBZ0177167.1 hypothetical protein [Candidatus Methanoperedens nitroreducens]CAG0979099.1 hypothetical protein METP2_01857 [Methanosarcinales archaeon]MCX9078839.1 hypothetical protein [Candidatus Methanoperedens sp.]
MNANLFKFIIVLAIIVVMAGGCLDTPVKVGEVNNSDVFAVEGGESFKEVVNNEWEILVEELPQINGIDYYKNSGYGITKVTFEYLPASGAGTLLHKKTDNDWTNKSRADYYVSGVRLLLKKNSGGVYDTGMILFKKDETLVKSITVPKEKFVSFKVEEVIISPGN